MTIKRIDIISIPVSDQARSKAFYVDKLGFTVRRDNPMGRGQRWVELATAEGETSIFPSQSSQRWGTLNRSTSTTPEPGPIGWM